MRAGRGERRILAAAMTTLLAGAGCSGVRAGSAIPGSTAPGTTSTAAGIVAPSASTTAPPPATRPPWPSSTAPAPPILAAPAPRCTPTSPAPIDAEAAGAATAALAAPLDAVRASGGRSSVSVRIDGLGEVATADPDGTLIPASNQKLLVAAAVLSSFAPGDRLTTRVVATGPVVEGTLDGDLVLVGGGDPTLKRTAAQSLRSLDALAAQVRAAGVQRVRGRVLVDESRYDALRTAPGWPDGLWQTASGPLSAVVVDGNRHSKDAAFFADPAAVNGGLFAEAVGAAGVVVQGELLPAGVAPDPAASGPLPAAPGHGSGARGLVLASLDSPTVTELVADMLTRSDNVTAELLVKELGLRRSGTGSTAAGLAAAHEAAAALCVRLDGTDADGSGLSRDDRRSARSWRALLEVATTQPWWPALRDGLAVAGRSGTLAARLTGPATVGNVRAKTGSTQVARSLSGYVTTAGGRRAVFSVLVNDPTTASEPAIDAFVTALAELP